VRHRAVVAVELLLRDEVYRGVVFVEVVRHRHDLALHLGGVGAFLQHHEAFAQVLLARGQLGVRARAHGLEGALDRDGVLLRVGHALDAAHGVRVALAHATAPERVVGALRQDAVAHQAVEREQARIPAARDERGLAGARRRGVHGREVGGDVRMRVEAVHDVVERRVVRRLLRQVGGAAAAEDEHVDGLIAALERCGRLHGQAFGGHLHARRVAARIHRHQLNVIVLTNGQLDALAEVPVPEDSQTHFTHAAPFDAVSFVV